MPRSCMGMQTRRLVLNCRSNRLRLGRPGGALCGGLAHGGAARGRCGRAGPGHLPHDRAQHQRRGAAVLRHTLVRARSGLHGRKHATLSRTSCPVLSQSWRVPHQLLKMLPAGCKRAFPAMQSHCSPLWHSRGLCWAYGRGHGLSCADFALRQANAGHACHLDQHWGRLYGRGHGPWCACARGSVLR